MSAEKALAVMRDGTERVLDAQPYETFYSREVTPIPGPYSSIAVIYVSIALEQALKKYWREHNTDPGNQIALKGLGDLSLDRAARLHARTDWPGNPALRF
jgi:hypothetical protein